MSPQCTIGGFEAMQHLPENPPLRQALARLSKRGSGENRARVYEHLLSGPILVAIAELPSCTANAGPGALATERELPVRFATARGPGGALALAVFTDAAAVAARNPSSIWLAIEPRTLLVWVANENLGGLVVNPQGLSAFIPRDDVLELAGLRVPRRVRGAAHRGTRGPETSIRRALDSLYDASNPHVFLILEEQTTKKSVQFARALDGSVTLDVFTSKLTKGEIRRAKQMFDGIAGYVDEPCAFEDPSGPLHAGAEIANFKAIFSGDPALATKSAMKIFTWVFGFPPSFDLRVEMR